MTLLLDTHTFLWFCQDDPSLSPTNTCDFSDSCGILRDMGPCDPKM